MLRWRLKTGKGCSGVEMKDLRPTGSVDVDHWPPMGPRSGVFVQVAAGSGLWTWDIGSVADSSAVAAVPVAPAAPVASVASAASGASAESADVVAGVWVSSYHHRTQPGLEPSHW